ncbi:hypothetical protein [Hymenobacter saemangeumensis]|uniref:hypothetical protein n=1 Tax=Hymenobacter saemangeumensis TaxID=1084522 RepID=UPI0031F0AE06
MTSTASPFCFDATAAPAFGVAGVSAVSAAAIVGAHHHHHLWEAGQLMPDAV